MQHPQTTAAPSQTAPPTSLSPSVKPPALLPQVPPAASFPAPCHPATAGPATSTQSPSSFHCCTHLHHFIPVLVPSSRMLYCCCASSSNHSVLGFKSPTIPNAAIISHSPPASHPCTCRWRQEGCCTAAAPLHQSQCPVPGLEEGKGTCNRRQVKQMGYSRNYTKDCPHTSPHTSPYFLHNPPGPPPNTAGSTSRWSA